MFPGVAHGTVAGLKGRFPTCSKLTLASSELVTLHTRIFSESSYWNTSDGRPIFDMWSFRPLRLLTYWWNGFSEIRSLLSSHIHVTKSCVVKCCSWYATRWSLCFHCICFLKTCNVDVERPYVFFLPGQVRSGITVMRHEFIWHKYRFWNSGNWRFWKLDGWHAQSYEGKQQTGYKLICWRVTVVACSTFNWQTVQIVYFLFFAMSQDVEVTSPPDDSISCLAFSPPTMPGNFLIGGSWANDVSDCRCFNIECVSPTHHSFVASLWYRN